jgi:hypothetical protein
MMSIKAQHKLNGFLSVFAGACGMFLFCHVNSDNDISRTTVMVVAYFGLLALIAIVVLEIVTLLRTNEKAGARKESDAVIVTEIADFWVSLSVALTIIYMIFFAGHALDPFSYWVDYGNLMLPIVALSNVLSVA